MHALSVTRVGMPAVAQASSTGLGIKLAA